MNLKKKKTGEEKRIRVKINEIVYRKSMKSNAGLLKINKYQGACSQTNYEKKRESINYTRNESRDITIYAMDIKRRIKE